MTTVLVVDDSPTEVHVFRSTLEKHGYRVEVATTGEEGLKSAKHFKPDVILMDVVMPGINGFQATRQLSKYPSTSEIPIILVTTKDQETDRVWGMRQGASDYLVKPVREKELLSTLQSVLAE